MGGGGSAAGKMKSDPYNLHLPNFDPGLEYTHLYCVSPWEGPERVQNSTLVVVRVTSWLPRVFEKKSWDWRKMDAFCSVTAESDFGTPKLGILAFMCSCQS